MTKRSKVEVKHWKHTNDIAIAADENIWDVANIQYFQQIKFMMSVVFLKNTNEKKNEGKMYLHFRFSYLRYYRSTKHFSFSVKMKILEQATKSKAIKYHVVYLICVFSHIILICYYFCEYIIYFNLKIN